MGNFLENTLSGVGKAWEDLTGASAAKAAEDAARLQGTATDKAVDEIRRQYNLGRSDFAPWLQAGRKGLTEYQALLGLGGDTAGAMRSLTSSPGHQFRLNLGNRSMEAGSAARGGMGSGKALAAANQFGQEFASNEYGNRLAQLAGLSGQGQASAAGQAAQGMQYAGNIGNLLTGNANAQGAAGLAGANARQSGLSGLIGLGLAGARLSDARLKTDILKIGTHKSGINLYSWRYVDKPDDFPKEFEHLADWGEPSIGVMSHEVREIMPDAVSKAGEYDIVNYSMLGEYYAN